jgi:probable rRNA maturation factor
VPAAAEAISRPSRRGAGCRARPAALGRSVYVGPWRVDVVRRGGLARVLPDARLARAAARALAAARAPAPASVTIVLTDDAELAELNAEHMAIERPTDVLSFPMLPPEAFGRGAGTQRSEGPGGSFGRRPHLGDIAISLERAVEQAAAGRGGQTGDVRWAPADELRLLVTHGVLHVCGWDHAEAAEEAAMRALEWRLLAEDEAKARTR